MKKKNGLFKKALNYLVSTCLTFFTCLPFVLSSVALTSDKYWKMANAITAIEKKNKVNCISAHIEPENSLTNYYGSNYFYRLQQISEFWSFDGPNSNTIFFHFYGKDAFEPIQIDGRTEKIEMFTHLTLDASQTFNMSFIYGGPIGQKTLSSVCEKIIISEKLADLLGITQSNYMNSTIPLVLNRKGGNSDSTIKKNSSICGVIKNESIGLYANYIESEYFIFTNWSSDLQLNVNSQDMNVLFFNDVVKNKYYVKEILNAIERNKDFKLCFDDKIGEHKKGSVNDFIFNHAQVRLIETPLPLAIIITAIFTTAGLVAALFILLIKKAKFSVLIILNNYFSIFLLLGGLFSLIILKLLSKIQMLSYFCTLNEYSSIIILLMFGVAILLGIVLRAQIKKVLLKKQNENCSFLSIDI